MVEPSSPHKNSKSKQKEFDLLYDEFRKKYSSSNIRSVYDFEAIIGSGSFGIVRKASLKKKKGTKFAIKTIAKENIKGPKQI